MNMLETTFDWLLATTLRASALAVVILAMQALLRRWLPAQWRHAMWMPLLLVLALPVLPSAPFGLFPQKKAAITAVAAPAAVSALEIATAPAAEAAAPAAPQATAPKLNPWALAWLTGTLIVLATGIASYRRNLRHILKTAVRVDQELRREIESAARELGLRRKPRVLVSTGVDSPAVTGLFRPTLLLPAGFPTGFSAAEARMILLHEFTHLKRLDLPLNWLTCIFQAMHWFNPILWFAFARMRADRESACDAQVLSQGQADRRSDYGHALLKLQTVTPRPGLQLGFVGIFESNSELKTRIREISQHRRSHPAWRIGGMAMIGALTLFGATKAQEQEVQQEQKPADKTPAVPRVTVNEPTYPGTLYILNKLKTIVIPSVKFENTSLEEAIDFVRIRVKQLDTKELDPAKKGVNFVIRKPRTGDANAADPGKAIVDTLDLKNATVVDVLAKIADKTGMRFKVDEFAVTFVPADEKSDFVVAPVAPPKLKGKAVDSVSKLIIPVVDFEDVTLEEAVGFVNLRVKELAKGAPVSPIVLDPKVDREIKVKELRLRNVPVVEALKYIAETTKTVISANDTEIRITKP